MRTVLIAFCGLLLRIFFRRVETAGKENVPASGPVVFILNHPNGLLDPLFILCHGGRRVSFLAKEPLFRMPVVGYFARTLECLPVYRKQDGADPAKNREMMGHAIRLLLSGNAIALFPEGTTHDDPQMKPFRPGAAKIALGATGNAAPEDTPVRVVPVGLYYSKKSRFRSKALMTFGPPVTAPRVELAEDLTPSALDTAAFTDHLTKALSEVTLQADTTEAMLLAERGERILRAAERDDAFLERQPKVSVSLGERKRVRQALVHGFRDLKEREAVCVQALIDRVEAYERRVADSGMRPEQRVLFTTKDVTGSFLLSLMLLVQLLPLALLGVVLHAPIYWLIKFLVFRSVSDEENSVATAKVLGGMLFFPLLWLVVAGIAAWQFGLELGLLGLVLAPLSGFVALLTTERAAHTVTQSLVVVELLLRPGLRRWVVEERRAIRDEIYALAAKLPDLGRNAT